MTKKQLDNLWELYREFCTAINATSVYVPDFLAWIERFKLEKVEQDVVLLKEVGEGKNFCVTYGTISDGTDGGKYTETTVHNGTCVECKRKVD